MLRLTLLGLLLSLAATIAAQQQQGQSEMDLGLEKRLQIYENIDSLVLKYQRSNGLSDIVSRKIDPKKISLFQSLFEEDAVIFDDVNLAAKGNKIVYPYQLDSKSVADYIEQTTTRFPQGVTVRISEATIPYHQLSSGTVKIKLAKRINARPDESTALKDYSVINEVELLVAVDTATAQVKISTITSAEYRVDCRDCDWDADGVTNIEDECPTMPFETADGCEAVDKYGELSRLYVEAAVQGGYSSVAGLNTSLDRLSYEQYNASVPSYIGNYTYSSSPTYGVSLALKYCLLKNKSLGLSAGFAYTSYSATLNMESAELSYARQENANAYWNSHLINGLEEDLNLTTLAIPARLSYRIKLSEFVFIEPKVGVSYLLSAQANLNSTLTLLSNASGYFDSNIPGQLNLENCENCGDHLYYSIMDRIQNDQMSIEDAKLIYNVGNGKSSGKSEFDLASSLLLEAGIGVQAFLSKKTYFTATVGTTIGTLDINPLSDYRISEEHGDFKSFFGMSQSIDLSAYHLELGIGIALN